MVPIKIGRILNVTIDNNAAEFEFGIFHEFIIYKINIL